MVKDIMNVKELAEYIGMSKSKIYQLIRQKKIPASKIGRQYRFTRELMDKWLKEQNIINAEAQLGLFSQPEKKRREPRERPSSQPQPSQEEKREGESKQGE